MKFSASLCFAAACLSAQFHDASAFSTTPVSVSRSTSMTTALQATAGDDESSIMSRRNALFGIMAATVGAVAVASPEEASARYSSYAHREQDWEERQKSGEINVKSARDLRAELKEIVPQNDSRSKIFCPNGPSAAVSPLMENKCGDRLAIPSVYGRTQDVVGNSIPGFATAKGADLGGAGGFPSYK